MKRHEFIKSVAILAGSAMMDLKAFGKDMEEQPRSERMPVLFIGHGSPMNGIQDNPFTKSLNKLGREIAPPRAILVISAHWLTRGTFVLNSPYPRTIYDFGGFPPELYKVKYEAPGAPAYASATRDLLKTAAAELDTDWGLDHGAWTILRHLYPAADIPVYQLSIDASKAADYHYRLATDLAPLRDKGVLIIGSGNIIHNLGRLSWDDPHAKFDWSVEFDEYVKKSLDTRQHDLLIHYERMGQAAMLSVPSNDHYLPMIYSIGLQGKKEELVYTYENIEMGSVSMRCFRIG